MPKISINLCYGWMMAFVDYFKQSERSDSARQEMKTENVEWFGCLNIDLCKLNVFENQDTVPSSSSSSLGPLPNHLEF